MASSTQRFWNPAYPSGWADVSIPYRPAVLDRDLGTPPVAPGDGVRYIVGPTPTGAWVGHETHIAEWSESSGAWKFEVPVEGSATWVSDENAFVLYDGSSWSALSIGGSVDAIDVAKGATPNWKTGSPPSGTDVETIIDSIVTDLADDVGSSSDGASRIGASSKGGVINSLAQGSIRSQLNELLTIHDDHVSLDLADDPWGWRCDYTSATTITMVSVGRNGFGHVPVTNGTDTRYIRSSSDFTLVMTTSGAGGLHNSHSEAANTGYEVYWAWGATPGLKLFAVPAGTTVDAAKIAALTGGTFTHWSSLAWFFRNNASSNIEPFDPSGPRSLVYRIVQSTLAGHLNTTSAQIPLTHTSGGTLVPLGGLCKRVVMHVRTVTTDSTNADLIIRRDSGTVTYVTEAAVNMDSDTDPNAENDVDLGIWGLTPSTALWADWTSTKTGEGATFYVCEVEF